MSNYFFKNSGCIELNCQCIFRTHVDLILMFSIVANFPSIAVSSLRFSLHRSANWCVVETLYRLFAVK